jgi:hypothetical protein
MVNTVRRLVLMSYNDDVDLVEEWTDRFRAGVTFVDEAHEMLVAVRAQDFNPVLGTLAEIETRLTGETGYAGWAVFHYDDARCQVPASCSP